MVNVEVFAFFSAIICFGIALPLFVWSVVSRKKISQQEPVSNIVDSKEHVHSGPDLFSTLATVAGLSFLSVSIAVRTVLTGHGPFSSMYEFAIAFAWGTVSMGLYFKRHYRCPETNIVGVIVAFGLLLFANTLPSQAAPLVPALQQSFLLSVHVAAAVVAYGSLTIGCGTAVFYLLRRRFTVFHFMPEETLDDISYKSVLIGFPSLTLVIVLGAIWAEIAWGRYWSWDPKETASLVTWLVYAAYHHTRILKGWRGSKSAILLIVGFAAILFTFFGNYFFSGLHSYG